MHNLLALLIIVAVVYATVRSTDQCALSSATTAAAAATTGRTTARARAPRRQLLAGRAKWVVRNDTDTHVRAVLRFVGYGFETLTPPAQNTNAQAIFYVPAHGTNAKEVASEERAGWALTDVSVESGGFVNHQWVKSGPIDVSARFDPSRRQYSTGTHEFRLAGPPYAITTVA
jgi:hypothetical protein